KVPKKQATVSVRIGAHTASAFRRQLRELGEELAVIVEQLLGHVALHPFFKYAHVARLLVHLPHWHLMGAPIVFSAFAVDFFGARPALRRAKHDHGPPRPVVGAVSTRTSFNALDLA